MAATATRTRTKKPVQRFCRLDGDLLGIQIGHEAWAYRIEPLDSDFGTALRLRKQEEVRDSLGFIDGYAETEVYDVCLDGKRSICGCLGFTQHGFGKDGLGCKHIQALGELLRRGKLLPALEALKAEKMAQQAAQRAQQRFAEWQQIAQRFPALAARLVALEVCP